ncbi:hypothetical protein [Chryseobacterium indologenes]|uniref:Uncharacterized protein n=1 Tax=Chryseobacterium indologenes TaxID=253 RepID=A0A0N0ZUD0_CHRID|nr:hypothetical protein [Chryseobacterium indologenes]KPE49085.1 hypothetical protein AOB46_21810 [Chryseobacterium indologenes]
MSNFIELNENKVYPKGNAKIFQNDSGSIAVSELNETTDGVIINTNGKSRFELTFEPEQLDQQSFGATMNILDKYNRVKTVAQWAHRPRIDNVPACLVANSLLEGKEIIVQFYKDGQEVHRYSVENPCDSQDTNWIQLAIYVLVSVGAAVASAVDYKKTTTTTTGPDGKTTTTVTTTKSFGNAGSAQKSMANSNAGYVDFDHIYITSSKSFDSTVYDELDGPISEVILNGNFGNMELKSISNEF